MVLRVSNRKVTSTACLLGHSILELTTSISLTTKFISQILRQATTNKSVSQLLLLIENYSQSTTFIYNLIGRKQQMSKILKIHLLTKERSILLKINREVHTEPNKSLFSPCRILFTHNLLKIKLICHQWVKVFLKGMSSWLQQSNRYLFQIRKFINEYGNSHYSVMDLNNKSLFCQSIIYEVFIWHSTNEGNSTSR